MRSKGRGRLYGISFASNNIVQVRTWFYPARFFTSAVLPAMETSTCSKGRSRKFASVFFSFITPLVYFFPKNVVINTEVTYRHF